MRKGIELLGRMGAQATMTVYRAGQVQTELALGRLDAAREALAEGLDYMARSDERLHEAGLHALTAQIALAAGGQSAVADAEAAFQRAREVARSQGAAGVERRVVEKMSAAGLAAD
jgi:hypothetical protein